MSEGTRTPAVSVVLPVYNERPEFLEQAVNSILEQTWQDFELLLLDDGSDRQDTLHTLARIRQSDARIRLHRWDNQGVTKSLNHGMALSQGALICRQDSDDWSEPTRLEKQVRFLEQNRDVRIVGSDVVLHQQNGARLWVSNLPRLPQDVLVAFPSMNPFMHGAVCFGKHQAEIMGGYKEALDGAEDYDFFWRLCECFGGANLVEPLYHYRVTPTAVSTAMSRKQARARLMVRQLGRMRASGLTEDMDLAIRQADELMLKVDVAETSLVRADRLMLAGCYREAWRAYWHSIIARPASMLGYLKLVRMAIFLIAPTLRQRLFHLRAI